MALIAIRSRFWLVTVRSLYIEIIQEKGCI
jgi:hypothetical protein